MLLISIFIIGSFFIVLNGFQWKKWYKTEEAVNVEIDDKKYTNPTWKGSEREMCWDDS